MFVVCWCLLLWVEFKSGHLLRSYGTVIWELCHNCALMFWFKWYIFQSIVYYVYCHCLYCWHLSQDPIINLCGMIVWGVYLNCTLFFFFTVYLCITDTLLVLLFLHWWTPHQVNGWQAERGTQTLPYPKEQSTLYIPNQTCWHVQISIT